MSFTILLKLLLLDSIFIGGGTYTKQVPLGGYARSRQLIFDVGYVLFSDSSVNGHQRIFDCLDFSIPNSNDLFFFSGPLPVLLMFLTTYQKIL